MIAVVRREALGPAEEGLDASVGECRHALQRVHQHRLEVLVVVGKLVEAEILRDSVHAPGLRLRLEGAEQDLARVLLVIGAAVVVAQHGQVPASHPRRGPSSRRNASQAWSGTWTPIVAASSRVHMPADSTTISAAMVPSGVSTPVTRSPLWAMAVTGTPSRISTPPALAPMASARVTSIGLAWPSDGMKMPPTTSSTVTSG